MYVWGVFPSYPVSTPHIDPKTELIFNPGAPRIVRTDCGTENTVVAGLQRFFRSEADDDFSGDKSFLYGKSSANQVNSSE